MFVYNVFHTVAMTRLFAACFFLLFFTQPTFSQECTGSLGDPVVNITFGSGSNPGPALPSIVTSYTNSSTNCPDDGYYNIGTSSSGCFGNSWHTVGNHTPNDPNGYMMIVNAAFAAGDFYVQQVDGLCGGTTYEFAAWILNILRSTACGGTGINPDLKFNIETTTGTVLSTYSTGKIPQSLSPQWDQYKLFFKAPPGVESVVIRLTNKADGGCGNDICLDDITFRACGPIITAANMSNASSIDQCIDKLTQEKLSANVTGSYNNPAYQWQKSTNNGSSWSDVPSATTTALAFTPAALGTVQYRLAAAEAGNIHFPTCRIFSNTVTVTVHPVPDAGVKSNSPVCVFDMIHLSSNSGKAYSWTGPDNFTSIVQNPAFTAQTAKAGSYTLAYTDTYGCSVVAPPVTMVINPSPIVSAGDDIAICNNTSATLNATGGVSYVWTPTTGLSNPAIQNPEASPHEDMTTYKVEVKDANGCRNTDEVNVKVWKLPTAKASPDRKILEGQTISLKGEVSGDDISYSWQPDSDITDNEDLAPNVSPKKDITYNLIVTSAHNCATAMDGVFIKVFKKLLIPNAFSPNGDGINDYWGLESLQVYPESVVQVYNRFGQTVFSAIGNDSPIWDGKNQGMPMIPGGYPYFIDLKNGTPPLKGIVFIVR